MEELFNLFYECSGVSIDTRKIEKEALYIALKGTNFDGNEYAYQALEKGAKYAVVDNKKYANESTIFYVENSLLFLQELAKFHRNKFSIPIIGITGSNGKTTTKELIAAVLSKEFNVHFTQGNFNNHIGVPLTLLQLHKEHEIAIIEMGASKLGDIKELCDITNPTHGIITNIGTAHVAGFGSAENILKTKIELYNSLEQNNGHIFYNLNDDLLRANLPKNCSTNTYGSLEEAEIQGKLITLAPEVHFSWKTSEYQSPELKTQIIGSYNLPNLLAAATIGVFFKVKYTSIDLALSSYKPTNNRSQLEKTKYNRIIMDAYNANPTSVKLALENFSLINEANKMFILGDMLELGEDSDKFHQEVINQAKNLQLQGIFVGDIFYSLAEENNILAFHNVEEVKKFLSGAIARNNLILLKGSRGIQLEKLMELL